MLRSTLKFELERLRREIGKSIRKIKAEIRQSLCEHHFYAEAYWTGSWEQCRCGLKRNFKPWPQGVIKP